MTTFSHLGLHGTTRGSMVLGLAGLLAAAAAAQDRDGERIPTFSIDARQAMQVRGTYGLVFVVPADDRPPTEAAEVQRLNERAAVVSARLHALIRETETDAAGGGGRHGMTMWYYGYRTEGELRALAVQVLLMSGSSAVKALLLDTVLLCGTAEQVGAKPGETLVLLDRFGKRVDGAAVDLGDEPAMIDAITALLHGQHRLAQRAARARQPAVARAIEELTHESAVVRAAARTTLLDKLEKLDECSAAVVQARLDARDERRRRALDDLIDFAYEKVAGRDRTKLLPFGAVWVERQGDPCPPCGMASAPGPSRKFMSLLAR